MKRPQTGSLTCLLLTLLFARTAAADECMAKSQIHVVPLVELYTAEGCSDCPPADKWLAELAKASDASQVSSLALHVDYWDQFGWPDPFSNAAYTKRQDFRVHLAKKKVRYTPHVMVGANTSVNWRDAAEVKRALSELQAKPAQVELGLQVERHGDTLRVMVQALPQTGTVTGKIPNLMWLALYQNGLVSKIGDGENKGKILHHDRVTRILQGPWGLTSQPVNGTVDIPLQPGVNPGDYGLVLFAESSTTGAGLQSLGLPLATCRW